MYYKDASIALVIVHTQLLRWNTISWPEPLDCPKHQQQPGVEIKGALQKSGTSGSDSLVLPQVGPNELKVAMYGETGPNRIGTTFAASHVQNGTGVSNNNKEALVAL